MLTQENSVNVELRKNQSASGKTALGSILILASSMGQLTLVATMVAIAFYVVNGTLRIEGEETIKG